MYLLLYPSSYNPEPGEYRFEITDDMHKVSETLKKEHGRVYKLALPELKDLVITYEETTMEMQDD